MIERHYGPTELGKLLGMSRVTIFQRVKDGTFAHVRLGGRILIPESEVRRVLDMCRVEGANARPATRRNLFAHA